MTNPILRRARESDYGILLELIAAFYEVDQHYFEPARIAKALPPLLAHDDFGAVYLIEHDRGIDTTTQFAPLSDRPMGYVILTWGYSLESGGREALIDEIFLQQRNNGIGTQVMPLLFDALRTQGILKIFLETETHNARARRFYARAGFVADDSIWMSRSL